MSCVIYHSNYCPFHQSAPSDLRLIDLDDVARPTLNSNFEPNILTTGVKIDWDLLNAATVHLGQDMGQTLTAGLALSFRAAAPQRPCLVGARRLQGEFQLYLTSQQLPSLDWRALPGYVSHGATYLGCEPVGWIGYWDGVTYHRLLEVAPQHWGQPHLAQDFEMPSLPIEPIDPEVHALLGIEPNWASSVSPVDPRQQTGRIPMPGGGVMAVPQALVVVASSSGWPGGAKSKGAA